MVCSYFYATSKLFGQEKRNFIHVLFTCLMLKSLAGREMLILDKQVFFVQHSICFIELPMPSWLAELWLTCKLLDSLHVHFGTEPIEQVLIKYRLLFLPKGFQVNCTSWMPHSSLGFGQLFCLLSDRWGLVAIKSIDSVVTESMVS